MKLAPWIVFAAVIPWTHAADSLPGTVDWKPGPDTSAEMVKSVDSFLMREIDASVDRRKIYWNLDASSAEAFEKSIATNRARFRKIIGAVDDRVAPAMEFVSTVEEPDFKSGPFTFRRVRWPVFGPVYGEGILIEPEGPPHSRVIALPDAAQLPEDIAGIAGASGSLAPFALHLAANGCEVLVPVLISRDDAFSGNSRLQRFTNQPHREWIYRQAYELGRHIIGYEVEKVMAAIDWFELENRRIGRSLPIGLAGYGEGGLLAFYTAALDTRVRSVAVSGYFNARQRVWEEPIYRNVFSLLEQFGDAEIARMIAPRNLVIEASEIPAVDGPPAPKQGRSGAAPGQIRTPDFVSVRREFERAVSLWPRQLGGDIQLVSGTNGPVPAPFDNQTVSLFLSRLLGAKVELAARPKIELASPRGFEKLAAARQQRQVEQLVAWTQQLLRESDSVRDRFVREHLPDPKNLEPLRNYFRDEVIGRFPAPSAPSIALSHKLQETEKWTAYEVRMPVWEPVFAWGILLLPKDIKEGERRPTVVCQHGLEGVPMDVVSGPGSAGYPYYKGFAAQLADRGYVTFAPHNPYRGGDRFRVLQRKANPIGKTLFSVIAGQHQRILEWLSQQPFVDPERIGFYGLSYGGKSAMRLPALLPQYALSICSADFNDWIRKNATTESPYSYLFTIEYEMPEFDLGETFNYAEMAMLISPRPFMVERGHDDGVAPDEWVAYEFAKVRRWYVRQGIGDRTEIEFFNGPHTIHGVGTFQFLDRFLKAR